MNVYEVTAPGSRIEMSACEKMMEVDEEVEDQTLHQPPVERNTHSEHGSARGRMFKTMLVVFNTLLLITILILIRPRTESGLDEDRELWHFHDAVFYLFWEAEGSCSEAQTFCKERGHATVGSLTLKNKDWILSELKGRKLWMNTAYVPTEHLNETLPQCPPRGEASESPETAQGWVCADGESFFLPDHFGPHFQYDEHDTVTPHNETDAPERSAGENGSITSSAGRVLSVYVIIVSVLTLL